MSFQTRTSKENIGNSAHVLDLLYTHEMILFIKTKYFHWISSHAHFMSTGILFEHPINQLVMTIEEVAGRINTLGMTTTEKPNRLCVTKLRKEIPGNRFTQNSMLEELLKDHESLLRLLRIQVAVFNKKQRDPLTAGILAVTMKDHESSVWTLRRQLVKNSGFARQLSRKQNNE